jgi:hypothetical protein
MNWEYLVDTIELDPPEAAQAALNILGVDGWELVTIIPSASDRVWPTAVYKRPRPPAQTSN